MQAKRHKPTTPCSERCEAHFRKQISCQTLCSDADATRNIDPDPPQRRYMQPKKEAYDYHPERICEDHETKIEEWIKQQEIP